MFPNERENLEENFSSLTTSKESVTTRTNAAPVTCHGYGIAVYYTFCVGKIITKIKLNLKLNYLFRACY